MTPTTDSQSPPNQHKHTMTALGWGFFFFLLEARYKMIWKQGRCKETVSQKRGDNSFKPNGKRCLIVWLLHWLQTVWRVWSQTPDRFSAFPRSATDLLQQWMSVGIQHRIPVDSVSFPVFSEHFFYITQWNVLVYDSLCFLEIVTDDKSLGVITSK